jgi:hypothetical protein
MLFEMVQRGERQLRVAKRLSVHIIHRVIERAKDIVFIIAVEKIWSAGTYQDNSCICFATQR